MMQTNEKKISDFNLLDRRNNPPGLSAQLHDQINNKLNYDNEPIWGKARNFIDKCLEKEDSLKIREALFIEIFCASMERNNSDNRLMQEAFRPVKDIFNDIHRASAWSEIISHVRNGKKTSYSYSSLLFILIDNYEIPDMQYKKWKKSIVNTALENKNHEFLSVLYLKDKTIFKPRHIPLILKDSAATAYFYKHAADNFNMPDNYTPTIGILIEEGIKNLDKEKKVAAYTLQLIEKYGTEKNLGLKFLPVLEILKKTAPEIYETAKEQGLVSTLQANKMIHELAEKSPSKIKFKI